MRALMLAMAAALLMAGTAAQPAGGTGEGADMRSDLIDEIRQDFRATSGYTGVARMSPAVGRALEEVDRNRFVPDRLADLAWENDPLPIGEGQTISQPFIVALMTELLEVDADSRVLEIGTGSGYQAAVLGEIVAGVWSVEIIESLAERAAKTLEALGYDNVHVRHGDGMLGWPEQAPFDGIIVTAAGAEIPGTLTDQLASGGRLVMPVGGPRQAQNLVVVTRSEDGGLHRRMTLPVRFVPVTGDSVAP